MAKPVNTTPVLPRASGSFDPTALSRFDTDLSRALFAELTAHAWRINAALPKDGSEPMTGPLDMGNSDITNLPGYASLVAALNAAAVGDFLPRDGTQPMTGDLDMDGNAILNADITYPGAIFGVHLSNAADADHDITVSAGRAASDDAEPRNMILSAARTKQLDATFAEGNNVGGMVSGESLSAGATIHAWLIMKADGTVDVCFNNQASSGLSPTLPTGFIYKRRIGSLRANSSSNIIAFKQFGDLFHLAEPLVSRSSTSAFAKGLLTISTPSGINTRPVLSIQHVQSGAGGNSVVYLGSGDAALNDHIPMSQTLLGNESLYTKVAGIFTTNTSAQLSYEVLIVSGSLASHQVVTLGWFDDRGASY